MWCAVQAASRATKALARAPGAAGPAAGAPSSPTSPHLAMKVLQPRSSADMAVAAGGGGLEVLAAPVPAAAEMEAMRAAARVTVAAPPVSLVSPALRLRRVESDVTLSHACVRSVTRSVACVLPSPDTT